MALSFIKSKPHEIASFIRHGYIDIENCTLHSISEFPDWFTAKPPRYDFVCLCILITAYSFMAIAIVCDDYCVPSVERICYKFGMSYDVAGATLLALATSAPELFISLYATFLTEGDMGIGTIVGSSVCNTLAVPAFCCLFQGVGFYIDWWPISRDLLWYKFAIFALTYFLWDGMIKWWEALILLSFYIVNVTNLLLDQRIQKCCRNRNKASKCKCFVPLGEVLDFNVMEDPDQNEEPFNFCHWPTDSSIYRKFIWLLTYPWELLFFFTIPSLNRRFTHNWIFTCLIMSICWISLLTYLCSWTMTVVGFYLSLPDSVMGLIVLAFGTSVPEIISSVIVTRKGYGSMAICNAMGSNTVNVFLCLGGPWLVKAFYFPSTPNKYAVSILSPGLAYITGCLLLSSLMLYILFLITRFQFNRFLGIMCLIMYLVFATMAVIVEMKYFESRMPHCTHIKNATPGRQSETKHWKYILRTRFLLIFAVLIVFYLRSFFIGTPIDNPASQYELNENSIVSGISTQRKISSVLAKPQNSYEDVNCSRPSILAFPSDGLTRHERRHGWIIVHMALMVYGFWFLACICDDYLVPSIEQICSKNNIQRDVIGATLMAAAVSSPELFMNFIGTFITKGDIGVGTIVGSAVFNVLAVPACCGLVAVNYFKLDWWPITRDCFMYFAAVLMLVGILWDGQVWWYEALLLVLAYFGYMLVMYHQKKICRRFKNFMRKFGYFRPQYKEINEFSHLLKSKNNNRSKYGLAGEAYEVRDFSRNSSHVMLYLEQQEKDEPIASPFYLDRDQSVTEFICRWPITFLLWLTVPNCRFKESRKYFTLLMSIIWISAISYVMAFLITVIGDTLRVPDAVLGLTVLAAGMSIPETVSSIIVTKQGQGGMGLSNSLGSNTFDILLSLGLPWFIKSFFLPDIADQKFLTLNSSSLTYSAIMLLTSLLGLYLVFLYYDFTLQRSVGVWCAVMYAGFMLLATLLELNHFFPVNLPICRQ